MQRGIAWQGVAGVGLSLILLAACSSEPEKKVVETAPAPAPKVLAAVSSRGRDTVVAGAPFATSIYLSTPELAQAAKAAGHPYAFRVSYQPAPGQAKFDTATMVADTGRVQFTPRITKPLQPGEVRPYEWVYKAEVDFSSRYPGPDTIFMVREVLYLKARP